MHLLTRHITLLAVAQAPFLARARQTVTRQAGSSSDAALSYCEFFVKTTGGGLQPTGSVAVGLAGLPAPANDGLEPSDASTAQETEFIQYHCSGRKYQTFPRPSTSRAGRPCGPSYGVGDTVGCGWMPTGEIFFTLNGRHLGSAFTEVWGTLCPAVDFDSPGACIELTLGREGQRPFRYAPARPRDGSSGTPLAKSPAVRSSSGWLQRMLPPKLADAAADRVDRMAAQAGDLRGSFSAAASALGGGLGGGIPASPRRPMSSGAADGAVDGGSAVNGERSVTLSPDAIGPRHTVMSRAQSEPPSAESTPGQPPPASCSLMHQRSGPAALM